MGLGNSPEQVEAAFIESIIAAKCEQVNGTEIERTYDVDEHGGLVINSTIAFIAPMPLEKIVIDLRAL